MHNYDDYTFCIFLYNLFTVFWICIIFLNLKVMNTLNSFLCISSSSNHTFQGTFPEHMQTFCIIIFWNTMSVILITSSIEMSNHLLSVYNLPESHCSVIHRSNLPHTSFFFYFVYHGTIRIQMCHNRYSFHLIFRISNNTYSIHAYFFF